MTQQKTKARLAIRIHADLQSGDRRNAFGAPDFFDDRLWQDSINLRLSNEGVAGQTVPVSGSMEEVRNLTFVVSYAAVLVLLAAASVLAAQFGTAEEAKAMLEGAVAAVKE